HAAAPHEPLAAARASLQFLAISLGPGVTPFWPFAGGGVLALIAASLGIAARAWRTQPRERFRAAALLLTLGATAVLAAAVGWGRSHFGDEGGLAHWYAAFGAPGLCAAYLTWVLYGGPAVGSFVRMSMLALACALYSLNTQCGLQLAREAQGQMRAFDRDL